MPAIPLIDLTINWEGEPSRYAEVKLLDAIEVLARELMRAECPFGDVSGDFDTCVSTTRNTYEKEAAEAFGLTADEYWDLQEKEGR